MPPVFFFNIIFVVTKTESKETVLLEILIFQCIPMGSFTKRNHCSNLKFWIWMKYGVADFSWRGPCHQKLQIFGFGLYFQGFQVVAHKSMAQQLLQAHGAASQGPLRTVSRNPWKQSPQQNIEFWATWTPPTKIGWTTPHCYPKYEIWMIIFYEQSLYKHSFWPPVEYWISCRNHVEWHGTWHGFWISFAVSANRQVTVCVVIVVEMFTKRLLWGPSLDVLLNYQPLFV